MSRIIGSTTIQKDDAFRNVLVDEYGNLCTRSTTIGLPVQKLLTENGLGTGTTSFVGNYSGGIKEIYYLTDSTYELQTLLFTIVGSANFKYNDYGTLASGVVTNGVTIGVTPAGKSPILLFGGRPVKYNYQWIEMTGHITLSSFSGVAQVASIEFRIVDDYGIPIKLNHGDKFSVYLHDNFTGLVSQTFGLRGVYVA
jgi:hypothetical protein